MKITIPIWQSMGGYASFVVENLSPLVGKLCGKTYRFIQTDSGAYITLISANILFFNIAVSICRFADDIFKKFQNSGEQCNEKSLWTFTLLFTTLIGGGNFVLCKQLNIPLSLWKVISVSFSANLFILVWKTWMNSNLSSFNKG